MYRRQIQIMVEQLLTRHGGITMIWMNTFGNCNRCTTEIYWLNFESAPYKWVFSRLIGNKDVNGEAYKDQGDNYASMCIPWGTPIGSRAHKIVCRSSRCFDQLQWPFKPDCSYLRKPFRERGYLVSLRDASEYLKRILKLGSLPFQFKWA